MSDPRLEYVDLPTWQQYKQQRLLGTNYVVIEPNNQLVEAVSYTHLTLPTIYSV